MTTTLDGWELNEEEAAVVVTADSVLRQLTASAARYREAPLDSAEWERFSRALLMAAHAVDLELPELYRLEVSRPVISHLRREEARS